MSDGRDGGFYRYIMGRLEDAATRFLASLPGEDAERYIAGELPVMKPAPREPGGPKEMHHAGRDVHLTETAKPRTLGELLLAPEEGGSPAMPEPPMITVSGTDKRAWLSWDGQRAHITGLDDYVLNHRRRMKPCTSFDKLPCDSG